MTASQSLKFPPDGLSLRWYIALLNADQMLWQVLGLSADPAQAAMGAYEYDVVVTVEVATVNAANFLFEVTYKLQ